MKTNKSRLLKISLITFLIGLFLIPTINYFYNKTIGYGETSCMIEYINKYYPNGAIYIIDGTDYHIDKRGIENNNMKLLGNVYGCLPDFNSDIGFQVGFFNTIYCGITYMFEKYLF